MITNITNYFLNLNGAGQALFIVGVLLIITFIVLLIVVFKTDKNKVNKIYGENPVTDSENVFDEKMKNIDNIGIDDINMENDITRNLKSIVDELKYVDNKPPVSMMERIEMYEDEQEDTAIISLGELLKNNKSFSYERNNVVETKVYEKPLIKENKPKVSDDDIFMEDISHELTQPIKKIEEKTQSRKEIFSSVFTESSDDNNETFLSSLKEFRNNL